MQAGTWVLRPNGKPAIVTEVRPVKGFWLYRDEVILTVVTVEWVNKRGEVCVATFRDTQLTEVPRA